MSDLRELLERRAEGYEPTALGWDRVLDRAARRRVFRRVAAGFVALVVAGAGIGFAAVAFRGSSPRELTGPAQNGEIYYRLGGSDGPSWIKAIQPDGSGEHVVFPPDSAVHYDHIAFSPEGTQIAFDNNLVGPYGIATADPDGSGLVQLTTGVNDSWPSFSPDGSKIAFSGTAYDPSIGHCNAGDLPCPTDIYVMNADGSDVIRLTTDTAPKFHPTWSPDGTEITFEETFNGTATAIYVMDADGTDARPVSSHNGGSDMSPTWSPDGTQIAFSSIRHEDWGIYVVNADGTGEHALLKGGYVDDPVWSPDGSLIAFIGQGFAGAVDTGDNALYLIGSDGTGVREIAADPTYGVWGDIAWQPLPTSSVSPTPSGAALVARVTDTITVGPKGQTNAVAYGEGSIWIAMFDGSLGGNVVRLDPDTGKQTAKIAIDAAPSWEVGGGGLTVGDGSVWVAGVGPDRDGNPGDAGDAVLTRIDVATNQIVAETDLGGQSAADVVVDETGVWVLLFRDDGAMEVDRLDPATSEVVARIPLDSWYGHFLFSVGGWIVAQTNAGASGEQGATPKGVFNVIDPATNTEVRTVPVGPSASPVAGDGVLWLAVGGDALERIDPSSGEVLAKYQVPNTGPSAVGNGGVWFLQPEHRQAIYRLNPETGGVDLSVDLPTDTTPIAIAISPGAVWVLNYEGTVTRVALT